MINVSLNINQAVTAAVSLMHFTKRETEIALFQLVDFEQMFLTLVVLYQGVHGLPRAYQTDTSRYLLAA
jgi:hypothetical protein